MLLSKTDNAGPHKRPINLSLTSKTVDMAKELGINLSQTVDAWLGEEVKRRYWERWREDNREAIDEYNLRIAKEGLPLEKYRTF
jgi:antitoxin CcdA